MTGAISGRQSNDFLNGQINFTIFREIGTFLVLLSLGKPANCSYNATRVQRRKR